LQVREANDQVRAKLQDFLDLRRRKRRNLRFLLARFFWTGRKSGNPDDAVFFSEQIQGFGGFLRQTNDALRS